jgi:hypothetical protein
MRSRRSTPGSTNALQRRTRAACSTISSRSRVGRGPTPSARSLGPASAGAGPRSVQRKPRTRTYGYDTLKFLIEVWTRIGQPCGKYLAPIMAPTVAQPEAFGELAKVADRLSSTVREQLVAMPGHDRPAAQTHQRSSLPRGEVRDPSRGHVTFLDRGPSGDGQDGAGPRVLRDRSGRSLRTQS